MIYYKKQKKNLKTKTLFENRIETAKEDLAYFEAKLANDPNERNKNMVNLMKNAMRIYEEAESGSGKYA